MGQAIDEAAADAVDVLSKFNLDQFSEEEANAGGWQTVGPKGAVGGKYAKYHRRQDMTKRLKQLLGSGPVMSEEQVANLNAASLKALTPLERQQFYRCERFTVLYMSEFEY